MKLHRDEGFVFGELFRERVVAMGYMEIER